VTGLPIRIKTTGTRRRNPHGLGVPRLRPPHHSGDPARRSRQPGRRTAVTALDYTRDLPGGFGLVALSQAAAAAVRQVVPGWWVPAEPVPWTPPAGYDPDPPLPEDDGWEFSPALERSLVAYVPG
jgi:hypothetical protein